MHQQQQQYYNNKNAILELEFEEFEQYFLARYQIYSKQWNKGCQIMQFDKHIVRPFNVPKSGLIANVRENKILGFLFKLF